MSKRPTSAVADAPAAATGDNLERLLAEPFSAAAPAAPFTSGIKIGTLLGFADGGATPLVTYADAAATAALPARATMDLHARHLGRSVVLAFENGDPGRPIIVGCLYDGDAAALADRQVGVEADGQRLVISAQDQIVLRCGKASITLTKDGKVIIHGAYVSNHSSGTMRIKGGSVHIN